MPFHFFAVAKATRQDASNPITCLQKRTLI